MNNALHLSNIPQNLEKNDLIGVFSQYGRITHSYIKRSSSPYTFGFLHYSNAAEANAALNNFPNSYGIKVAKALHPKTNYRDQLYEEVYEQHPMDNVAAYYENYEYVDFEDGCVEDSVSFSGANHSDRNVFQHSTLPTNRMAKGRYIQRDRYKGYNPYNHLPTSHHHQQHLDYDNADVDHPPSRHGSNGRLPRKGLLNTPPLSARLHSVQQHEYDDDMYANDDHGFEERPARQSSAGHFPKKVLLQTQSSERFQPLNATRSAHGFQERQLDKMRYIDDKVYYEEDDKISAQNHSSFPNNNIRPQSAVKCDISDIPKLQKNWAVCSSCGRIGRFLCTNCEEPYCSRECQVEDWPIHSQTCQQYEKLSQRQLGNCDQSVPRDISIHAGKETCRWNVSSTNTMDDIPQIGWHNRRDNLQETPEPIRSDSRGFSEGEKRLGNRQGLQMIGQAERDVPSVRTFKGDGSTRRDGAAPYGREPVSPSQSGISLSPTERGHLANIKDISNNHTAKRKSKDLQTATLNPEEDEMVMVSFCMSPNQFWLNRITDADILKRIEAAFLQMVPRMQLQNPTIGDLCCSIYRDNNLYRCTISKVHSKEACDVFYIDYGNTATVDTSRLFDVTNELATYPALAINCKLAGIKPVRQQANWSVEDVEFLSELVEGKVLKAKVLSLEVAQVVVDLADVRGNNIASILVNEHKAEKIDSERAPDKDKICRQPSLNDEEESLMYDVPSILKKLKEGTSIAIEPILLQEDQLWGWVKDMDVIKAIQDMESQLQATKSDEITLTVEEGDLAVVFSPSYKSWYRSYVMKRSKDTIRVRYIDYGNEEDVVKVFKMASAHIKVISPVLCLKLGKLAQDLKEKMSTGFSAIVDSPTDKYLKLMVTGLSKSPVIDAHPWYYGLHFEDMFSPIPSPNNPVKTPEKKVVNNKQAGQKRRSPRSPKKTSNSNGNRPVSNVNAITKKMTAERELPLHSNVNAITEKIIVERELALHSKTFVNVVWGKSANEVYVQKISDQPALKKLLGELNAWCASHSEPVSPKQNQVVCAKYEVDRNWYRSLVLKELPEDRFQVFFVDFGNVEIVSKMSLRDIKNEFICPQFCIPVCIKDVPANVTTPQLVKILGDKNFQLKVVDPKSKPKGVLLLDNDKSVFSDVNTSRVSNPAVIQNGNSAVLIDAPVLKKAVLETKLDSIHNADVKIAYIDDKKYFHVQLVSSRPNYFSMKKELGKYYKDHSSGSYTPEVNDLVCVSFSNDFYRGYVVKKSAKGCVVKFVDDGFTEDIEKIHIRPLKKLLHPHELSIEVNLYKVNKDLLTTLLCDKLRSTILRLELVDRTCVPPLVKLFIEDVCVNDVIIDNRETDESKDNLFVLSSFKRQFLPLTGKLEVVFYFCDGNRYFLQKLCDANSVNTMSVELQRHCSDSVALEGNPAQGTVICAKCSDDQVWYRACIKKVINGRYEVLFVDYGNSEIVEKQNLRELSKNLATFPIYAISVTLSNSPTQIEYGTTVYSVAVSGTEKEPVVEILPSVKACIGEPIPCPSLLSFKKSSLELDEVLDVVFQFSKNSIFFLQKLSDIESMNIMLSSMQEICAQASSLTALPSVGDVVCAKSLEDQTWYRACVNKIIGNACEVTFIDYGNNETIEMTRLSNLTHTLASFPIYAISVSLKNSFPVTFGTVCRVKVGGTQETPIVELAVEKSRSSHPKVSIFSSQTLSPGETIEIVFQHSENDLYFAQKVTDLQSIAHMSQSLQKYCAESQELAEMPTENHVVCAKSSEDQAWYRASVKKIISDDSCEVAFIDYGNSEKINKPDLRKLPEEMISLMIYTIPVSLKSKQTVTLGTVYKVKVSGTKENLVVELPSSQSSSYHISSFKKQTLSLNKTVEVVFQYLDGQKYFLHRIEDLQLIFQMSESLQKACADFPNLDIVPKIDDVICVKRVEDQMWYRAHVKNVVGDTCEVIFIDYGNSEAVEQKNTCRLPEDAAEFPLFAVSVSLQNVGSVTLGDIYKMKTSGTKDDIVLEMAESSCSLSSLNKQLPAINDVVDVVFQYCDGEKYYFQKVSDLEEIVHMSKSLQELCNQSTTLSQMPNKNDIICAKSSTDQSWYRACVEKVTENECEVSFIDYGNKEILTKSNLCKITKEMATFPVFAIPACLQNLQSVSIGILCKIKVFGTQDKLIAELLSDKAEETTFKLSAFQKVSLTTNETVDVIFQYFENGKYFLHRVEDREIISQMTTSLQKFCNETDVGPCMPEVGDVVCAKCTEDQTWYRGHVKNIVKDACEVNFIDYGNSEMVEKKNLCRLSSELASHPIFAVSVTIKDPQDVTVGVTYNVNVSGTQENMIVEFPYSKLPELSYSLSSLKELVLPLNEMIDVVFQHSEDGKYFLQMVSDLENVAQMTTSLQECCNGSGLLPDKLEIGQVACAQSCEDHAWYRVSINEITEDNCKVNFLDYGNTETVPKRNLRKIPNNFACLPIFATPVTIHHNQPVTLGIVYSVKVSSLEGTAVVQLLSVKLPEPSYPDSLLKPELLPLDEITQVIFKYSKNDKFYLQKYDDLEKIEQLKDQLKDFGEGAKSLTREPLLNEVLITKSPADGSLYRISILEHLTDSSCGVLFLDSGRTEVIQKKDLYCFSDNLCSIHTFAICVQFSSPPEDLSFDTIYSIRAFGSSSCPSVEIIRDSSHLFSLDFFKREVLSPGEIVDVIFWCREEGKYYLQKLSCVNQVQDMSVILQKHCVKSKPLEVEFSESEVLCAKCVSDQMWYRASIKTVKDDYCDVVFIDYGNSEKVYKSDLRPLSEELASIPIFAIPVELKSSKEIEFGIKYSVRVNGTAEQPSVALMEDVVLSEAVAPSPPTKEGSTAPLNGPADNCFSGCMLSDFQYCDFESGEKLIIVYSIETHDTLFCAPFDAESINANALLLEEMTEFCNTSDVPYYKPTRLNEMVLAKFPDDNCWYRALVVSIDGDLFTVCFVDYGGLSVVSEDNIKQMVSRFMSLPIQAHCCKLKGMTVLEGAEQTVLAEMKEAVPLFSQWTAIASCQADEVTLEIPALKDHLLQKKLIV